jgi:hypothetical protein
VTAGILVPIAVLLAVIVGGFVWYRRSVARMSVGEPRPVSGTRLTAEALHRLASPPWRVVYEIGGALGGVDHVVIGPPGVIALATVMADRPVPGRLLESVGAAQLVGEAAVARGPVDELVRPVGLSCRLTAKVFWGGPDARRPAADDVAHGSQFVEGQRIADWLEALSASTTAPLESAQVDLAWQAIVLGIGRPNPLG